uniref:Uncharacterized protein n=1 Tax=Solanum lycopersicum TaxID=4081 RepID=A0A3Q7G6L1_SOLLC
RYCPRNLLHYTSRAFIAQVVYEISSETEMLPVQKDDIPGSLGRLEPVPAYIKKNKRGLGAEKPKKAAVHPKCPEHFSDRKILKDGNKESVSFHSSECIF